MRGNLGDQTTGEQLETLRERTFYGREKENLVYPIALANLVLHGIDRPHLWHGNTLTGQEIYGGLFQDAPALYDVVLTNPPFGGKEGKDAQTRFAYKTGATQVLFLQDVIDSLKPGGRCGIVLDEGVLFRTNEIAFLRRDTASRPYDGNREAMPGTPAAAAYGRSICQTTFSEKTSPCAWSARLTGLNTYPEVTVAGPVQASMATFTQTGIGTVRTRPCFPKRSTMHQRPSRCWMCPVVRAATSDRHGPQPSSYDNDVTVRAGPWSS